MTATLLNIPFHSLVITHYSEGTTNALAANSLFSLPSGQSSYNLFAGNLLPFYRSIQYFLHPPHGDKDVDYTRCYQILGLDPGSDWSDAVKHYRSLAARYHPDRQGNEPGDFSAAEINIAYRTLKKYYQSHGALPLSRSKPVSKTPFPRPRGHRDHSLRNYFLSFLASAILFYAYSHLETRRDSDSDSALSEKGHSIDMPPEEPGASDRPDHHAVIWHGDSLGKVAELLGPPDDTREARWYYGDSWIQFRDGRVIDWHSTVGNPLPVSLVAPARGNGE